MKITEDTNPTPRIKVGNFLGSNRVPGGQQSRSQGQLLGKLEAYPGAISQKARLY